MHCLRPPAPWRTMAFRVTLDSFGHLGPRPATALASCPRVGWLRATNCHLRVPRLQQALSDLGATLPPFRDPVATRSLGKSSIVMLALPACRLAQSAPLRRRLQV